MSRLALAALLFTLPALGPSALASDVHVRVDPSAPPAAPGNENLTTFPTIQNALDHHPFATPNPDGTPGRVFIEIVPGTYRERVIVTQNHPNITLIGLGQVPRRRRHHQLPQRPHRRRHLLHRNRRDQRPRLRSRQPHLRKLRRQHRPGRRRRQPLRPLHLQALPLPRPPGHPLRRLRPPVLRRLLHRGRRRLHLRQRRRRLRPRRAPLQRPRLHHRPVPHLTRPAHRLRHPQHQKSPPT